MKTPAGEFCVDAPAVALSPPDMEYLVSYGHGNAPWRECFAIFSPSADLIPLLQWSTPLFSLDPEKPACNRRIARRMKEANSFFESKGERRRLWAWNALEEVLLLLSEAKPEVITDVQNDERIARAVRYIRESFSRPLSVDLLAAYVHVSPSRFAHLFRERVGLTPMQFLEKARFDHALELLMNTQIPVGEIALRVGFENASHFSQRFRAVYHCSPSGFRSRPANALIATSRKSIRS